MSSPSSNEHKPVQPSHNLYHRQPAPRNRRHPPHDDPSAGEPSMKPLVNPVRVAVIGYIKKLSFVLVLMGIVFFISVKTTKTFWSRDQQKVMTPPGEASTNEAPETTSLSSNAVDATALVGVDAPTGDPVRDALALAKQGDSFELSNTEEAIKYYRAALDTWPNLPQYWAKLGALYLETKDYPKAEVALEKALEREPLRVTTINDLGVALLSVGKTQKAFKLFEQAIALDPQFAPGYFNIALCYLNAYQREAAEEWLNRFLVLRPNDPQGLRELAVLYAARHRFEDALALLQRAIGASPRWALLYLDAAATAALMGNDEQALKYLKEAESFASPAAVYRIYQGGAFQSIRFSDAGKEYEKKLTAKMRTSLKPAATDLLRETALPMSSSDQK